jgi:hypothetical protein
MIYLFTNQYMDKNPERDAELCYCEKLNGLNPFIQHFSICGKRLTYSEFFGLMNKLSNESVVVLANSDIYFDETIQLAEKIQPGECYALSRWDIQPDGTAKPFHRADSQDAWIFRAPIKEVVADFTLGIGGCDNRIAYILNEAGYKVTNPCSKIKAYHLHLSGVRNYIKGSHVERIEPPYLLVKPE